MAMMVNVPVLVSPLSQVSRGVKDLIMEPVVVKRHAVVVMVLMHMAGG